MKRTIFIILLMPLALMLSACGTGNNGAENDQTKAVAKANGQTIQESTSSQTYNVASNKTQNQSTDAKSNMYEIIGASYTSGNVKINYPQISNLSDSNKEKAINEIIRNEALKGLNYYSGNEHDLTLEINFDIKWQGPRLLSIQYSGVGYVNRAAHPNNLFYTTNINMDKGSRLRLKDLVNIDKGFIEKFKDGTFKALNPIQQHALDMFSDEDLLGYFSNADSLDNIGTENQSDTFSYFTRDSLGISVSVSHAIGDHAEFEVRYQDIASNIKAGNEVWKDFFNSLN